ncbi:MAG: ABC transporter [Actinomycetota bacterium]|nr:ABC transporter [Actinomycetota bacterium]
MHDLLSAVESLREQVAEARLPLDLPDVATSEGARVELLRQLDDYVIPRLTSLDAPLLAVVGGSTGAGKSTLVNSLVGRLVSKPGVLRPTTRSPVLVHHPDDAAWFADHRVLPELARVTGGAAVDGEHSLRLVSSDTLPRGLAFLDAPDIDSVVESNRALARQLLSAADLWLFVTTAARYADAVPWELLRRAHERGTAVAVVLDRVSPELVSDIRDHLGSMLRAEGLAAAPIFTIPESRLGDAGLLPADGTARLHSWLTALAKDTRARAMVVRQTLSGALDSLEPRIEVLSAASAAQEEAAADLVAAAEAAYATAAEGVRLGTSDGTLLRGEVLARWQEFVGTGEFFKQVETTVSRLRDRVVAAVKGDPPPSGNLGEALETGVSELVRAHAQSAAAATVRQWRSLPGGPALVEEHPALGSVSPAFSERVAALVHDWQGDVLDLVRTQGQDRRTTARVTAYGVNAVGTVLILVTFAHTGGLTGAEAGIAGGTAILGQKLLEAIFGDQAVRTLATKARQALIERVEQLYDDEEARFTHTVAAQETPVDQAGRLAAAALAVKVNR